MPRAAKKPCAYPRCGALVERNVRYCDQHQAARNAEIDRNRGTTAQRGYDAAWRRLRLLKLSMNPLCECDDCVRDGVLTPADVVDHRKSIEERPDLRLELSNLRSMAKAHHDRHTARTQGFAQRKA
jgi:5-methylcytosine-specific restriction enzyme A